MTVFDDMMATLFADPNLAVAAVLTTRDGEAVAVKIVRRRPDDVVSAFGGTSIKAETFAFDVQVAEIETLEEGMILEIAGELFIVEGAPVRDADRLLWSAQARPYL